MNKIYVSGMNSRPNPSSGLGIARCLKDAFPKLVVVGVDHTHGSTGLHDPIVDEVMILPKWNQIHDDTHAKNIREILDAGHLWFSSLDMEVHWISENVGPHLNMIAPHSEMLKLTAKPGVSAWQKHGFHIPEYISASIPDSDIHGFLRANSWQCWLKSPYHDAKRVSSWSGFKNARFSLGENWKTSELFLQRNVVGNEETIAFAAYQGEFLGAVHLEKCELTAEGKTWIGRVTAVEPAFLKSMRQVIRDLNWSGGGELEFVRDADGEKWLIECNPRFPAWIYGAALNGFNLPARVASRVWGIPFQERKTSFPYFARTVLEIPAKPNVGIPLPPDAGTVVWQNDSKSGKGGGLSFGGFIPTLAASRDREEAEKNASASSGEPVSESLMREVTELAKGFVAETPSRVFLEERSSLRFDALSERVSRANIHKPRIQIGYSVKTSPTDDHLKKAKAVGFYAECITQMEIQRSLRFGFKPGEIMLNGPGKFWPLSSTPVTGLHTVFCDSVEELGRVLEIPGISKCVGLRIRVPNVDSRFGNPVGEYEKFQQILKAVRKIKGRAELGFHFHMPSWSIGVKRWMDALDSLLLWCHTIGKLTGVPVQRLDLGGGFFPNDLDGLDLSIIQRAVRARLPSVLNLYFEPGRALTQDTEVLFSRVLDIRAACGALPREIVVDACVAELPFAQAFPHRIFYHSKSTACIPLKKGKARILGRICMEDDILCRDVDIPDAVEIGDLVIFGDAGGYERSMSYGFGRG